MIDFKLQPLGSSVLRPSIDCQSIITAGDSQGSGYYFIGSVSANAIQYCNMTATTGMSLGGDGSSVAAATTSCTNLKAYFNKTSGFYTAATVGRVYCDMSSTPRLH